MEVLGYHKLTDEERLDLEDFLERSIIVPLSEAATKLAIALRQTRNVGLADSLIAATALEADWDLATRNVDDFCWIDGLRLVNPFDLSQ